MLSEYVCLNMLCYRVEYNIYISLHVCNQIYIMLALIFSGHMFALFMLKSHYTFTELYGKSPVSNALCM